MQNEQGNERADEVQRIGCRSMFVHWRGGHNLVAIFAALIPDWKEGLTAADPYFDMETSRTPASVSTITPPAIRPV